MKAKYDRIGGKYNRTRRADKYLTERLVSNLSSTVDGKYLDIGCGTGNYTIALSERNIDLVGVDPSIQMLRRASERNNLVKWIIGRSDQIPFGDEFFDGVLATLTIHHWDDLDSSFAELNRVLKANSKFVLFTSTSEQMKGYWLNHYFSEMLKSSMRQMPSMAKISGCLISSGFEVIEQEKYFVSEDLEDSFLYSGKNDPQMYLDEEFRFGISSFSDLANASEIEKGLERLTEDIATGKVFEIIEDFKNDAGDYLFVVSRKTR